ncbi:PAS domain-containing protein [Fuscibacter oryzae]|uniref:PAS domain-containing protein n=1 Tax=Fuscibacter oryzae TaxID=2803939 RepID=A0A8J7MMP6_9RHOB|nr:PAS domain-containing protein [Fuscibacter oryzae]MBL4927675.1 PAS domain-containing protein [Fuscibacter oryzae]
MDLTFPGSERKAMTNTSPLIQQVRAYWEALRDGTHLPARTLVDPRGLSGALEHTFLLEQIAPGMARFRLAGMHFFDLMGMEVKGMPLSALITPASRDRLAQDMGQLFAGRAILDLWLEAERGLGLPALKGRMILLPITGTNGQPDMALGCLETQGETGRKPRRFGIAQIVQEPILQTKPEVSAQPILGLAESQAPFTPTAGRPHLRLVHSRD